MSRFGSWHLDGHAKSSVQKDVGKDVMLGQWTFAHVSYNTGTVGARIDGWKQLTRLIGSISCALLSFTEDAVALHLQPEPSMATPSD